ncbi:MAG: hypothetical protein ACYC8T_24450 [Myxococcaceae bacterium]
MAEAPVRLFPVRPPGSPPAVWAAFARQGAWKSWALAALLGLNALLVLVTLRIAKTEPDVVVVDGEGRSTYVQRRVAGDALVRYLAEARQQPSDLTVRHFSAEFLKRALAINSSTVEEAWPEALAMMAPALRARMQQETAQQKLLETYRLAQVRTSLTVEGFELLQRTEALLAVRAQVRREKSRLLDGAEASADQLVVELVLAVVPRTPERADGLEACGST